MRAVYLARSVERPFDVTWERLNYRRAEADGARGTVSFSKAGVVALFFDPKSPRAPANSKKPYVLAPHLQGMRGALLHHAGRETFATMELESGGQTGPVVTAAFWSEEDGTLVGARSWARLAADGARLVDTELARPEKAIATFADKYGFSQGQTDVVTRLFGGKAKLATSSARVVITAADRAALGLVTNQIARDLLDGAGITLE